MNKEFKILFLVTVVFVLGAWLLIKNGDDAVAPVLSPSIAPTATPTPTLLPTGGQQSNVITYTDSGYSPATITIKKGQTVIWKNNSSREMWTASAIHPTHTVYPGTDIALCGKLTFAPMFDSCKGISSGQSWLFKFDSVGTWKYHNHSNPSHTGTVVVE